MDEIILIEKPISKAELKQIALKRFGDMVKAVVDLEKNSNQENLWGINIYPDIAMPDMVEFDSMINIRPRQNNRSRGVEDEKIRKQILEIIKKLII